MKKAVRFFIVITCLICGIFCNPDKQRERKEGKSSADSDTIKFFPINDYIVQQIKEVDSLSVLIYKISIDESGKKDSTALSKEKFDTWAKKFLEYNIEDTSLKKYYKESLFLDQTTNSYTFTYTPIKKDLVVQTIIVLLDTDNQKVKRVFINKEKDYKDSSVIEKLGWKNNSNFFVNKIIQYPNGKERIQQNSIVWNEKN